MKIKSISRSVLILSMLVMSFGISLNTVVAAKDTSAKKEKKVNTSCAQPIVQTREMALLSSLETFQKASLEALKTRSTELIAAWGETDKTKRNELRKTAWTNYKTSLKSAKDTFAKAKKSSWDIFQKDLKTCKVQDTESMPSGSDSAEV